MASIGFIGMGNMGYAMLLGALKVFDRAEIVFSCATPEKKAAVYEKTGVRFVDSNAECANSAKYIVLAVKPQVYDTVIKNTRNIITPDNIIISLAPGVSIEHLRDALGVPARIVRAMPNTPAMLGAGMTGISYNRAEFSREEIEVLNKFFNSFGMVAEVPEKLMGAVTCASGSSPAYVYMFIEALADSVVKLGIPRDKAYVMVAKTVEGAAKMVLETREHPAVLKDKVCSPGGTTICGVEALEEYGFRNAIMKATEACNNKSENMK